jgi:hypothetical protein
MATTTWSPIATAKQLEHVHERSTFDAKQTYDLKAPTTRYEMAKDVSAFASSQGGTILVGAIDHGGQIRKIVDVPNAHDIAKAFTAAVRVHCTPIPKFARRDWSVTTNA